MRGEHSSCLIDAHTDYGSSPHARGTPRRARRRGTDARIIPACAGNTLRSRPGSVITSDHPRMRGEHVSVEVLRNERHGSSPHARGTPEVADENDAGVRIIPACAGNTPGEPALNGNTPDHPRMRGEHRAALIVDGRLLGSSPHARGTLVERRGTQARVRIIPACAGNTCSPAPTGQPRSDHPRMRGEHDAMAGQQPREGGSSPHARGTL